MTENRITSAWTAIVLAALLVWQAALQWQSSLAWGPESWQLSEWLINYAGGFVRRGLPGELFLHLSTGTGIPANLLVIWTSFALFLLLLVLLVVRLRTMVPPAVLLSCVVMGFPAYQDSIVRKDCLLLVLFAACAWFRSPRRNLMVQSLAMNFFCCLGILCHEAYVFFALPALLLFAHPGLPRLPGRLTHFLPTILASGMVITYHGSPEVANAIHNSWMPLRLHCHPAGSPSPGPSAAIEAIGWSASQGMSLVLPIYTSTWHQPLMWALLIGMSGLTILLFNHRTIKNRSIDRRLASIVIFQLAAISPLFLVGIDFGRWIFLWTTSSLILLASPFDPPLPLLRATTSLTVFTRFDAVLRHLPLHAAWLLVIGLPVLWNVRNFITASPVGRVAESLADWISSS